MAGILKFTDTIKFSLLDPNLIKIKDHYEGAFKSQGIGTPGTTHPSGMGTVQGLPNQEAAQMQETFQGLQVRIAATHSGIITGNNGFYLPDRMKKGSSSFTDNFNKPILLHHNEKEDAVGRVIASKYIDTSGAVLDRFADMVVKNRQGKEIGTINDTLINDFCSGRMPYGMAVDTVRTIFQDSLLSEPLYDGLGHIELVANITDPEAIQKLLDGRYLTGSVGASTNSASCSICRQDWTDMGQCEHKPGGIYDGQKCFIIAGDLNYSEYSFVNKPADRHSRVLQLDYNGVQDNIKFGNEYSGRIYEVQLGFPQFDDSITTKEEDHMATEPKKDIEGKVEIKDSATDTELKATDDKSTEVKVEDTTAEGKSVEGSDTSVQDNTDEGNKEETTEAFIIRVADSKDKELTLTDEEDQKLYEALWTEVLAAVNDGDIVIAAEDLKVAKLSLEDRKKLPKSKFAGPNRSFPVRDCAHVAATRRLLDRVKLSDAAKVSIMETVNRKSKAMACPISTKKADALEDNQNHSRILRSVLNVLDDDTYSEEAVLSDDDKKALQTIVKRMASLVGKDSFTSASLAVEAISRETNNSEQGLLDEIVKQEETIGELRDSLQANRKENAELYQDYEGVQDSLVKNSELLRKAKESQLEILRSLRDSKVEKQDFTEVKDSELQSEIDQTLKLVDMVAITDKLGDGMSREPVGTIDDPTVIQDNTDNNKKKKYDINDLARIDEKFTELLLGHGQLTAEAFLTNMRIAGRLPQVGEKI